jgi:nucleotide-binding universal stress UspA family protein
MELAGIPVHTQIMPGLPLDQIHEFLEEQAIDLVVLCSRGQISCRPRAQRSMALQVLQQSSVPVLILQETLEQSGTLYPRDARPVRLLVPLDGSALAETVIAPAAFLASALSAPLCGRLHLIRVLPSSDFTESGGVIGQRKKRARDQAQAYLQAQSQVLSEGAMGQLHLSVTTSVLLHPNVAETIVQVAEAEQHDGETAESVLKETHLPFLVVHPPLAERKGALAGSMRDHYRDREERETDAGI